MYVNEQPIAILEIFPGFQPLEVQFDATVSYDPDGGTIDTYIWEFGDGTIIEGPPVVFHQYEEPGEYGVSVTVFDNDGGESASHHLLTVEEEEDPQIQEKSCGCKSMSVKTKGAVEGPAGFDFSPEGATGVPPAEQAKLGPYAGPTSAAGQLDMTKTGFTVVNRFEVIAELVPKSKPQLCAEGQKVKRTAKMGKKTYKKSGSKTSDPRYDSSADPDDPYDAGDDATKVEKGKCGATEKDWCDDDYHGGGGADGTGKDGLQPPNGFKKYVDESKILWLDAPGLAKVSKTSIEAGGASYTVSFEAIVSGPLGTCKCTWNVSIKVNKKGKITSNKVKNIKCS